MTIPQGVYTHLSMLILSNLSTTCVCIPGVFSAPACVGKRELEAGSFSAL